MACTAVREPAKSSAEIQFVPASFHAATAGLDNVVGSKQLMLEQPHGVRGCPPLAAPCTALQRLPAGLLAQLLSFLPMRDRSHAVCACSAFNVAARKPLSWPRTVSFSSTTTPELVRRLVADCGLGAVSYATPSAISPDALRELGPRLQVLTLRDVEKAQLWFEDAVLQPLLVLRTPEPPSDCFRRVRWACLEELELIPGEKGIAFEGTSRMLSDLVLEGRLPRMRLLRLCLLAGFERPAVVATLLKQRCEVGICRVAALFVVEPDACCCLALCALISFAGACCTGTRTAKFASSCRRSRTF